MKKSPVLALVLSIILCLGMICTPVAAEESTDPTQTTATEITSQIPEVTFDGTDASITHGCRSLNARYPLHSGDPVISYSDAAVLYEVNSGTMLYMKNPDETMYPSSLVKVMTALLAVEKGDLDEVVTVTSTALSAVPKSAMKVKLKEGEQMTLRNLLYCMIVGSGNDAATVIAEHIAGSQGAFVDLMNKRAKELGCTGTTFMNSHGLHDPKQVTTARDMARITTKVLDYPEFMTIFGTAKYSVPATNTSAARHLVTVNYMVDEEYRFSFYNSKVTGGRTGITEYDERCLVVTAQDDNSTFVGVILGAEAAFDKKDPDQIIRHGSFEDMDKLLDLGFDKHSVNQVLYRGQILDQLHVPNGENDIVVGPVQDLFCTLPDGVTADQLTNRVQMLSSSLEAPIKRGEYIALVQVWYGNTCVAQTQVQALNDAKVGQIYSNGNEKGFGLFDAGAFSTAITVLIIIGALILGLSIGMLIMRRMNKKQYRRRRRRRR